MGDTVLIVGDEDDSSADAVARELATRGVRTFRFDTINFPQRARLTARFGQDRPLSWSGLIETGSGELKFEDVVAVYYRKPRDFEFPSSMSEPERRFSRAQARVGLGGILASLPARWVNHPGALADSEYKPRQLAVAARCGLAVPPTLITNEAAEVREFAAEKSPLVVKPLAAPIVHEGGGYSALYTRLLTDADFDDMTGVEATAHLFQQSVAKAYEVRLTAVGRNIFPVAIFARSAASRVDWRTDYDSLTYEQVDCPDTVVESIAQYLRMQGLVYGAFDFIVRPDGEWVFLECNAAGQWGWISEECDLPIASAIADALVKGSAS